MANHLILGAGPVARAAASALLRRGHRVVVGTRSGTVVAGCEAVTVDASNASAVTAQATGCESILICTNPEYHRWPRQWPPIIDAAIHAASATGARIVLMGNLYPFGRPTGPMTHTTPNNPTETKGRVRAELWDRLADAAHTHGFEAAELRASDYFGPDAGDNAHAGSRLIDPIKAGKTAWVVGDPDAPHSWSYLPDIGQCLAILATTPKLSGQYWVGPSSGAASLRELATRIDPHAKVKQIPGWVLRAFGLVSPTIREVARVRYQHTEPYLVDDSDLRAAFNFTPTPLNVAWDTCTLS